MGSDLIERIKRCPSLPSMPAIALQVLELAQTDHADLGEIARIISKDPALSSKILKTVNSSFYARSQSISSINHALVILGLQSVKTLVLGFSLVSNLSKTKARGFQHLTYWRRSVYAATAARTLAARLGIVQQEECFLAALLQDIGMLVLDQVLGPEYGPICDRAPTHLELCAVERAELGMTHAQVSGVMGEMWKLPPLLRMPMTHHHTPEELPEQDPVLRKVVEVVHLSGICADVFVDANAAPALAEMRQVCMTQYGMSEPDCDAIMDDICRRTREVAPLFEISVSPSTNYESILKKANEALVELTMQMQQRAETLQQINSKLRVAATTDGLTGLANRATFDEFISEQFAAATASNLALSMLLIDVDHFKGFNDTRGHQTGDDVLRTVGKLLKGAARVQDLAARYGGEEMVLVMPGTTRATAAAVAESIRRAIAIKPISTATGPANVTISVGVATLDAELPLKHQSHLIKAADMAVYAAKNAGRNCVKVFTLKSQGQAA